MACLRPLLLLFVLVLVAGVFPGVGFAASSPIGDVVKIGADGSAADNYINGVDVTARAGNGYYLVVWSASAGSDYTNYSIKGRLVDEAGEPAPGSLGAVRDYTSGISSGYTKTNDARPRVIAGENGYLLVWHRALQTAYPQYYYTEYLDRLHTMKIHADGTSDTDSLETLSNTDRQNPELYDATFNPDLREWVVSWNDVETYRGSVVHKLQRFDRNGELLGSTLTLPGSVARTNTDNQPPEVAYNERDGHYVIIRPQSRSDCPADSAHGASFISCALRIDNRDYQNGGSGLQFNDVISPVLYPVECLSIGGGGCSNVKYRQVQDLVWDESREEFALQYSGFTKYNYSPDKGKETYVVWLDGDGNLDGDIIQEDGTYEEARGSLAGSYQYGDFYAEYESDARLFASPLSGSLASVWLNKHERWNTAYNVNTHRAEYFLHRVQNRTTVSGDDELLSLESDNDSDADAGGQADTSGFGVAYLRERNEGLIAWSGKQGSDTSDAVYARRYRFGFAASWDQPIKLQVGETSISKSPTTFSGTPASYALAAGESLPAGVSLNATTGVISGQLTSISQQPEQRTVKIEVTSTTSETITVPVRFELLPNQTMMQQLGPPPWFNQTSVGDPVNTVTGSMYDSHQDFLLPGRGLSMQMVRTYNSADPQPGPLGYGWNHLYQARLDIDTGYETDDTAYQRATLIDHQGSRIEFRRTSGGAYTSPYQIRDSLAYNATTDTYTLTRQNGARWIFDAQGKLTAIKDRNDNQLTLAYTSDKLTSVTDDAGKQITLSYTGERITSIAAPDNRTFTYAYNSAGELTTYTDATGASWNYTYNAAHQITKIETPGDAAHPRGEQNFTYQADGRVAASEGYAGHGRLEFAYNTITRATTVTDARNNASVYHYDARGNLTQIDDPDGTNQQYGFGLEGNRTSVTDQRGKTTNYQYDTSGNVTEIRQSKPSDSDLEAARPTTTMSYGVYDQISARTDPEGKTVSYTYDTDGNLLTLTDEANKNTSWTYNSSGQPLTSTDANGRVTKYTYNTAGFLASEGSYEDALDLTGKTNTFTYNAWGDETSATDPLMQTTTTAYDKASRTTTVTLPEVVAGQSDQITYEYDPRGNLLSAEDPLGHGDTQSYDRNDQLIQTTDATGKSESYQYDAMGNLTQQEDAAGISTDHEYTKQGWLKKTIQEDGTTPGRINELTYRADGKPTSATNARGKVTAFTYDNLGRLSQVTDADAKNTSYQYDKRGLLTASTNANDHTSQFVYDARGDRISKQNPLGNTWQWRYDDAGLLDESEDALNRITAYNYNEEDQLTQTSFPASSEPSIDQSYDDAGRLLSVIRGDKETAYQYDARDRLAAETQGIGANSRSINYGYDRADRLTSKKLPGNSVAGTYTYDNADRLTTLTDARSSQTNYSYDTAGRLAGIAYPGLLQSQAYTYTAAGETDTITHSLGLGGTRTLDHSYDKNGNLTGLTDTKGSTTTTGSLAYDDLDRLSSESYVKGLGTKSRSYSYDPAGNRSQLISNDGSGAVTTGYTYNDAERMTQAGAASYSYNANGEMTAETKNSATTGYSCSHLGETTGEASSTFEYDGLSRRVKETHNSTTMEQVYEGDQVAQQYNGTTLTKEMIRDPAGSILAEYTPGLLASQAAYHYQDLLGSSVEVTPGGLTQEQSTSYNAFGDTREAAGLAPSQFTYLGNQINPAGKTHNFHARSYDAANGRFLSEDPIEGDASNPATQNPYNYGGSNPYANPDPSGLYWGQGEVEGAFNFACEGLPVCSTRLYYLEHPKEDFSWKKALEQTGATWGSWALPVEKVACKLGCRKVLSITKGKLKKFTSNPKFAKAFGQLGRREGSLGPSTNHFASSRRFDDHFNKHKAEWGGITKTAYLKRARTLLSDNSSVILTKTRPSGDLLKYNPRTNELAIQRGDGVIKTLFRPIDRMDYWRGQ